VTGLPFDWPDDGVGLLSERLAAAVQAAISTGRLRPGDRLPSSRTVAAELEVSRWVATQAYEHLAAAGWLSARTGSGTHVAALAPVSVRPPKPATTIPSGPPADRPVRMLDLAPSVPDLASFPRSAWRAALTRVLATLEHSDLGYPDPRGDTLLRGQVCQYLRRVRGIDVGIMDVLITRGAAHGLGLLCRVLAADGRTAIAMEEPGWPRARAVATAAGLRPLPLPVDHHGLRTDRLDGSQVDGVFVTATHQYPTGVPLSAARRTALLRWARDQQSLVIEDDYDAEFRFDRRPVGALASLDQERVAYLGSTSKTLAPAIRLGWLVLRGPLAHRVAALLEVEAAAAPTLEQRTLATLLGSGSYDRHLRRMRRIYQSRREAMIGALREAIPLADPRGMPAGMHLLVDLPNNVDEQAVLTRARQLGLILRGLGSCYSTTPTPAGLIIGYAGVRETDAPHIARTIAQALIHTP